MVCLPLLTSRLDAPLISQFLIPSVHRDKCCYYIYTFLGDVGYLDEQNWVFSTFSLLPNTQLIYISAFTTFGSSGRVQHAIAKYDR